MVLFLFIIMLLDVEKDDVGTFFAEKADDRRVGSRVCSLMVVLVCQGFFRRAISPNRPSLPVPENPSGSEDGLVFTTSSKSFGYSLFTKYMLPFQVTGFLLLAAMIGVIVVSKETEGESGLMTVGLNAFLLIVAGMLFAIGMLGVLLAR